MKSFLFIQRPQKEEQTISRRLAEVVIFVENNYDDLKRDLLTIKENLGHVETYAFAYGGSVGFIPKGLCYEAKTLRRVFQMLDRVNPEGSSEVTQGIDFFDLNQLLQCKDSSVLRNVWKAKRTLDNMMYQFERVKNEFNIYKQIAILRGMIAYY